MNGIQHGVWKEQRDQRAKRQVRRQRVHGAGEVDIPLKSGTYNKIDLANTKHNHQTRNDNSYGGKQTTPHTTCSRITDISGTVDANRARSDLADS